MTTTDTLTPQEAHRQARQRLCSQTKLVDEIAERFGCDNPVYQHHVDKLIGDMLNVAVARQPAGCEGTFRR